MSVDIIWFDNRVHYDEKWLFKDSFYGINNLRISILPNGFIQQITWFYLGNVLCHQVSPQDLSSILDFLSHTSPSNCIIIRYMFESTLSKSFNTSSLSIGDIIYSSTSRTVFKYLHICDTHHGFNPIFTAYQFSITLNPDFLSCNQVHHLHFFPFNAFLNLPRVSIDNISVYRTLSSKSISCSRPDHLYFPAVKNNIHVKRFTFFSSLKLAPKYSSLISSQRFNHYPDWLRHLACSSAFVYVPLSSSIGLNNILPAAITNTNVFAYRLSPFTAQHALYHYFGLNVKYFSSVNELIDLVANSLPPTSLSVNSNVFQKLLPTPKNFFNMILNNSGEIFGCLHPASLDHRFLTLQRLSSSLSYQDFSQLIFFYENLQFLYEHIHQFELVMFKYPSFNPDHKRVKYLDLLVRDISQFTYTDSISQESISFDIPIIACIVRDNFPFLEHILDIIPTGSFILFIDHPGSRIDSLNCSSHNITNPFINFQKPDIYQKTL